MKIIDAVVRSDRYAPRRGWHDDHRMHDRTPEYLPAMQQVRSEYEGMIRYLADAGVLGGKCLQLGMGECRCSHDLLRILFPLGATTIDFGGCAHDDALLPGVNTHQEAALEFAAIDAPYDFLLIDAGHLLDDVVRDHADYARFVRPGGVIGFHDACERIGFEDEVLVWKHLRTLQDVTIVGTEVGFGLIRTPAP